MDGRLFLNLMRALIPRWNFFDQVGHCFRLEVRGEASGPWHRISFLQKRRPLGLFFNPETNLALLQVGLLEHFVFDIQALANTGAQVEVQKIEALTTYRLLRDLVIFKMHESSWPAKNFQFKIVAIKARIEEDLYVSNWLGQEKS